MLEFKNGETVGLESTFRRESADFDLREDYNREYEGKCKEETSD